MFGRRRGRAMLADGSDSVFDIYEAVVTWDGGSRRIAVDEVECDPACRRSRSTASAVLRPSVRTCKMRADGRLYRR